jgi:hypothetical protein
VAGYGEDDCHVEPRWVQDQWGNRYVQHYRVCY